MFHTLKCNIIFYHKTLNIYKIYPAIGTWACQQSHMTMSYVCNSDQLSS